VVIADLRSRLVHILKSKRAFVQARCTSSFASTIGQSIGGLESILPPMILFKI
jgi:hypothetical protein